MQENKQSSCDERIDSHLKSRLDDLKNLWSDYVNDESEHVNELGELHEYGLSLDYHENNNEVGYMRFQLFWGGPSDEFRFYLNATQGCYSIEYAFQDWFDGATRIITGEDRDFLMQIFEMWQECEIISHALENYEE